VTDLRVAPWSGTLPRGIASFEALYEALACCPRLKSLILGTTDGGLSPVTLLIRLADRGILLHHLRCAMRSAGPAPTPNELTRLPEVLAEIRYLDVDIFAGSSWVIGMIESSPKLVVLRIGTIQSPLDRATVTAAAAAPPALPALRKLIVSLDHADPAVRELPYTWCSTAVAATTIILRLTGHNINRQLLDAIAPTVEQLVIRAFATLDVSALLNGITTRWPAVGVVRFRAKCRLTSDERKLIEARQTHCLPCGRRTDRPTQRTCKERAVHLAFDA
jgi:hypothetical protein